MTTMIVIIGEYDDKDDGDDGNNGDNDNDDDDDTYYTGKNVPACLVAYKEDSRYLVKKRFSYFIRNCPVVMMEAMNDECQEAIIGAFTRMHPNEIYLTKEQASEYYMLHALMSGLASHFTPHHTIP